MKPELVLFGKHIDMATRRRRRALVLAIYGGFTALIVGLWFFDRWHVFGSTMILFTASYVSRLVLGGYGAQGKGMVKPFLGNRVRARYLQNPNSLWAKLCRVTLPNVTDERVFCSDERELRLRDSAHEVAYRSLGAVLTITFFVAYLRNCEVPLLAEYGITSPSFDIPLYGLLMCAFILFLTLPQSILLWTEPNLAEPQ
jgi:hypothetical protein